MIENLHEIATRPPAVIAAKHLKGLIVNEVLESSPLLPNYTLLLKIRRSGDEMIISSARYERRDDGQNAIETKEVFKNFAADPNERNTFIDLEKNQNFRTLRRMFDKLPDGAKGRFRLLFRFALAEMSVELIRAGYQRHNLKKQIE
jgi:hypothetical protein